MIAPKDKLACAERELAMRKRVYPGWIAAGKMKPEEAAKQIEVMAAIVDDYRVEAAAWRPVTRGEVTGEAGAGEPLSFNTNVMVAWHGAGEGGAGVKPIAHVTILPKGGLLMLLPNAYAWRPVPEPPPLPPAQARLI